jgi:hypothetical protein
MMNQINQVEAFSVLKKVLLMLGCIVCVVSCKGDPETNDLKDYVTNDLYNIRTHLRAASNQYESTLSKNEKARADIIRTKVVYQYQKYLEGLQAIKTETAMVDALNDTGVQSVEQAINDLEKYRKIALRGNAHQTLRARSDAETAMENVRRWQKEVWESAKARGIEIPEDIGR